MNIAVPIPEPEQKTTEAVVHEEAPAADAGKNTKGSGVFGGIMAAVKFGKGANKEEEPASNKPGMLSKAMSTLSGKEEAVAPPPPPPEIPKITVYVSRGGGSSGHPTYEV